jgi:hypothetical protein
MTAHLPIRIHVFDIIYVLLYVQAILYKDISLKFIAVTVVKFFFFEYLLMAYNFTSRIFCGEISWF